MDTRDPTSDEISITDIIRVLWRRKTAILSFVLLITAGSSAYILTFGRNHIAQATLEADWSPAASPGSPPFSSPEPSLSTYHQIATCTAFQKLTATELESNGKEDTKVTISSPRPSANELSISVRGRSLKDVQSAMDLWTSGYRAFSRKHFARQLIREFEADNVANAERLTDIVESIRCLRASLDSTTTNAPDPREFSVYSADYMLLKLQMEQAVLESKRAFKRKVIAVLAKEIETSQPSSGMTEEDKATASYVETLLKARSNFTISEPVFRFDTKRVIATILFAMIASLGVACGAALAIHRIRDEAAQQSQ